jgi:hypothetical protein
MAANKSIAPSRPAVVLPATVAMVLLLVASSALARPNPTPHPFSTRVSDGVGVGGGDHRKLLEVVLRNPQVFKDFVALLELLH